MAKAKAAPKKGGKAAVKEKPAGVDLPRGTAGTFKRADDGKWWGEATYNGTTVSDTGRTLESVLAKLAAGHRKAAKAAKAAKVAAG